jgi:ketosteroid isomerase-like protein
MKFRCIHGPPPDVDISTSIPIMSSPNLPVQIVQSLYAAFGRGDVPAILAQLRPDVDWHVNVDPNAPGVAGVPLFKPCRGPQAVAGFFQALASGVEMHSFEPISFLAGGNEVAVRVVLDGTTRSTKRRLKMEAMHHWILDDAGKVKRFVDFLDSLGEANAWNVIKPA